MEHHTAQKHSIFYPPPSIDIPALYLSAENGALVSASFSPHAPYVASISSNNLNPHDKDEAVLLQACVQLQEYCLGMRKKFDICLAPKGSAFYQDVWRALLATSYGKTQSYTQICRQTQNPTAVRATATAIGKNPINIIIPCHRIILKGGAIGNYTGGACIKKALLTLEGAL